MQSRSGSAGPVFVTGASGFLGEHLCRALRAQGTAVRALCRGRAPELVNLGVTLVPGDLTTMDPGDLVSALRKLL